MLRDAGEHPAEHVVLLDDVDRERAFAAQFVELATWDHEGSCAPTRTFSRNPHRVLVLPPAAPSGSSAETPFDR